jgi:16S rRNA (cytidine1402-2'-O)-methyltransferase
MPGTLFVVATPIGNLEDVTARALRVLREVAVIAAEDTRRTAQLLARYGIETPQTSLHEHNEASKAAAIVARLKRGDDVALVSDAGTPVISDPGERLIAAAVAAGIRVEPVPGPSAILAALAASGLAAGAFTFLGFPPTRSKDRKRWFETLKAAGHTVVFFEAPHRVARTLTDLRQAIGDRPVAVARELTKAHEELVRGPISTVAAALGHPRGELTIVVDVGYMANIGASVVPRDADIASEFGDMTEHGGLTRREAISKLARKYRVPARDVFAAIDRGRASVE